MLTAEHFGNPLVEQRKLLNAEASVLLDDLAVLRVEGPDRLDWLHALLSQNIKNLKPGESAEALLLDPNGRIEQAIRVFETGNETYLSVSKNSFPALTAWLSKMIFRSKVSLTEIDLVAVAYFGEVKDAPNALFTWTDSWDKILPGSYRYGKPSTSDWPLNIAFLNSADAEQFASDFESAGRLALTALRIAAHRPDFDSEVDEKTLPHELDWLRTAVHLTKGCYRGQETVAKVHNLGHPPRRLVMLHLDGSGHMLPEVNDSVIYNGEVKGRITSVAQHFDMGPIALAVISRNVPEDAQLEVASAGQTIAAAQEIIVPASAGKVAELPKRNLLMGGKH